MRVVDKISIALLLGWLLVAIGSPMFNDAANEVELARILASPSGERWLGCDELGRPLALRLAVGARYSLAIAVSVVIFTSVLGCVIGLVSAWLGGSTDRILVKVIDAFMAFPGILLAIALAGILGAGVTNVVVALSVVGWVGFARLARSLALSLRTREHVQVAYALGVTGWRIPGRHILPLMAGPLIVEASFAFASVIVAEAGLSFLGLGIQPPTPSWGAMIREGTRYLLMAPHAVLVPRIALMSVVLSINMLGDRLRDVLGTPSGSNELVG